MWTRHRTPNPNASAATARRHGGRRRGLFLLLGLALAGFAALNLLAHRHAHAMLHFAEGGRRTRPPERLSGAAKWKVLLTGVTLPRPANTTLPDRCGLPYETHTLRAGGERLEAWHVPSAGTNGMAVLFHGYGSSKCHLLPEARIFHDMGYAAFLLDFRGSGGSGGNDTTLGFREAEDVSATVRYVTETFPDRRPLVLYGLSMGGAAVLRAIAQEDAAPDCVIVEAVFDRMLSTVRNRFHAMRVPSFPSAELLVFWGGIQTGFPGFAHNPADYARRVRCPVLMLHGEEDPRATLAQARAVYDHLPGPKRFESFPGVRHEPCAEVRPEKWKAVVQTFLRMHCASKADGE